MCETALHRVMFAGFSHNLLSGAICRWTKKGQISSIKLNCPDGRRGNTHYTLHSLAVNPQIRQYCSAVNILLYDIIIQENGGFVNDGDVKKFGGNSENFQLVYELNL